MPCQYCPPHRRGFRPRSVASAPGTSARTPAESVHRRLVRQRKVRLCEWVCWASRRSPGPAPYTRRTQVPGLILRPGCPTCGGGWTQCGCTCHFSWSSRVRNGKSACMKLESATWPFHFHQLPIAGERDVGGPHVLPAKTDVGGTAFGRFVKFEPFTFRREDADPSAHQRSHADVSPCLESQGIETLEAGQAMHQLSAGRRGPWHQFQFARAVDRIRPEPAGFRFRYVECFSVRRNAHPVSCKDGVRRPAYRAAIRAGVIDTSPHDSVVQSLAKICEPEAALCIEHNVVRPIQGRVSTMGIENLDRPSLHVHALDVSAFIIGRFARGTRKTVFRRPAETAVVAHVAVAVGADCRPIWPATERGNGFHVAVRLNAQ